MKKIIFTLLLLFITSILLSNEYKSEDKERGEFMMKHRDHTESIHRRKIGKIDINVLREIGLSEDNIKKALEIVEREQKYSKLKKLDIDAKKIEIKREMLRDEKNWFLIEKLLKEEALLKVEQHINRLKSKEELSKYIPLKDYVKAKKCMRNKK